MRRHSLLPVLAFLTVSAAGARADDPASQAAALIEKGLDLRQAQRDTEALALFEKAESIAPTPRGRAQVALAEQALGRWVPAEKDLTVALGTKGDPWIDARRPILDKALAVIASHLGDVVLTGAQGVVYVDGAKVEDPAGSAHLRLEVGRRTLEIRAPGLYPFSRVLDVLPGETLRVEVEQHPLLDQPAAPQPPPTPPPPVVVAPAKPSHVQRTLGWVSLAGAAAFVGVGIAGVVDRDVAAGKFNGDSSCTGGASSAPCQGWLNDGSTGQTLSIVGFVGGGVVGALGVALLVTAPSTKPKQAWFPCSPAPGGGFCSISGTF